MTHAMVKLNRTVAEAAEMAPQSRQPTQVASPAFASVHGAAQTVVVVVRSS